MPDLDRTREHLEVLADALTLPSEGAKRVLPLQRQNPETCPSCNGTGYVRYRPAESQHRDDYCEQDCATCRPARQRAWEARMTSSEQDLRDGLTLPSEGAPEPEWEYRSRRKDDRDNYGCKLSAKTDAEALAFFATMSESYRASHHIERRTPAVPAGPWERRHRDAFGSPAPIHTTETEDRR